MSLSHQWRDIEYNIGLNIEREANGERGTEDVLDSNGNLIEHRSDVEIQTGIRRLELFLNSKAIFADTQFQFNGKVTNMNGPEWQTSTRTPQDTGVPFEVFFKDNQNRPSFELGLDAERSLTEDLDAKIILLYTNSEFNLKNLRSNRNTEGVETSQRISDSEQLAQEAITRLEFDWVGIENHNIQMNLEGAYNSLDGTLLQTLDTGSGPVVIDVPNGNIKVEEIRGDFAIKDTWELGKFQLDYGLGAEVSRISQSGDTEQDRDFFFVKPQLVINYTPAEQQLSRLILIREIAQLDFGDFISATEFEDNDLALGNPNLRPDTTWITELSHEYRYGSLGVIKASVFHHWISDVLDLLPLSETFEAPGNIGKGRRWGVSIENTIPMEWLGLRGARLDLKVRWQDSSVTDPVTGEKRILSATQVGFGGPPIVRFRDNGSDYVYNLSFRQDLEISRIAWGVDMGGQGERPRFKVNELEVFNEGMLLTTFIETTRWFDIKIRLEVTNLLNYTESRLRTLYETQREISPIESQIVRDRTPGRRTKLVLSGSF
jgi:outer membrane receptor protein involved in Fe transport